MNDWSDATAPLASPSEESASSTGDARVDAVLASLGPLGTAPVSAHVAVFETAIASLRTVLDDPGAEHAG
jgi:hypothetical protein